MNLPSNMLLRNDAKAPPCPFFLNGSAYVLGIHLRLAQVRNERCVLRHCAGALCGSIEVRLYCAGELCGSIVCFAWSLFGIFSFGETCVRGIPLPL